MDVPLEYDGRCNYYMFCKDSNPDPICKTVTAQCDLNTFSCTAKAPSTSLTLNCGAGTPDATLAHIRLGDPPYVEIDWNSGGEIKLRANEETCHTASADYIPCDSASAKTAVGVSYIDKIGSSNIYDVKFHIGCY